MPHDYKVVVLISRKMVRAAQVEGESVIDPIEMEWTPELLRKAFSVIKTRYQSSHIRIILDEDVSHALTLEIPESTPVHEERDAILAKIKTQIPEVASAENWDYKVKSSHDDMKEVTVFVPVQDTYLSVTEAAVKEGLEIDAVEPISSSLGRNPNPFVGMAQKTDLRGDDPQVLNVQPLYKVEESTGTLEAVADPLSKKKMNKILLMTAGLILFGLLTYGVVAAVKKSGTTAAPSPSPTAQPMETPSPSPTPEPVDISTLKIKVENGTGVPGEAGAVAAKLETAGFAEADTGNADNYEYVDTTVRMKDAVTENAYTAIVKALQPDYSVEKGTDLDDESEFDIVVIVGKKASALGVSTSKPSATPRPAASATPRTSSSPAPSVSSSPKPSGSASASPSPSASASPTPAASASPSSTPAT